MTRPPGSQSEQPIQHTRKCWMAGARQKRRHRRRRRRRRRRGTRTGPTEPTACQEWTGAGEDEGWPKTGFQLWLEENRQSILSENAELQESEIIKEGMSRFRGLTNEERMVWTEKAKGDDSGDSKKRKREEQENRESIQDSQDPKKRKPVNQSANQRLSAFAFKKD